jgi:hypothetical protein
MVFKDHPRQRCSILAKPKQAHPMDIGGFINMVRGIATHCLPPLDNLLATDL